MVVRAKAIIPAKLIADPAKIIRACENALDGAALAVKADFGVTVQTWSDRSKPEFEITRAKLLRTIFTTGQIYNWVNDGTSAHTIRATRVHPKTGNIMPMAFKVPYTAKTAPRVIGSGPGGTGLQWVSAKEVEHPGIEARQFDQEIYEKWQRELPDILQRAIDSEVE